MMRPDIALLYVLLRLLALVPLRALHAIGAALGWLLWRSGGKIAQHTAVNIRLTRPHLDAAAQATLARAALAETGKAVAELARLGGGGARRALKLVREVRGAELFDAALASGQGVIVAAPHLGCWELLNHWLCARTPMAILYRPPRIAALEALLRRVRGDLAPEQVRAEGAGVRTLYRRLAAGGTVGILPDQKPRQGDGQVAPFFGVPALTMVLLPRLAARTGARVLYAFAERLPRGEGFRIHLLPAPDGLADADLPRACAALNQGVEACVERAFAQYQWHYKRFSGDGLKSPYERPPRPPL
jgi:KDO2-lipid IV(A) lauroyltransferase